MVYKKLRSNRILVAGSMIFFALVFVLCPITSYSKATPSKNKEKIEEKQKPANKENANNMETSAVAPVEEDNTLYDYEKPTVEEESYTWLVIKTIIVLGALVAGFYYFFKFVTKKTGIQAVGRDVAKVLSILPVGQNKFLQVIDLAGRILVIGVSDSAISLITEIEDRNEIDRIRLLSSKSTPPASGGFSEHISKYISKLLNKESAGSIRERFDADVPDTDRMDYLKKQRERLKKMNGDDNEM